MAEFDGRRIVVGGGAGEVGEGIVRSFLKRGATVIVPSRTAQKLDDLHALIEPEDHPGTLVTIQADTHTEEGMVDLRDRIESEQGAIYGAVASLGGWWGGAELTEMTLEDWQFVVNNNLTSHFIFAKAFVPLLARLPGSSYTLINGGAALSPVPKSGAVSIMALAQVMLKSVLAHENKGRIRVNTLLLATPVITRSRERGQDGWLTCDDAGEYCVYLASKAAKAITDETIHFKNQNQLADLAIPE